MTSEKTATRRRYSAQLKAQVVAECDAPGASVAKVAMSRGINANVVHGWRKRAREAGVALVAPQRAFVPVALEAAPVRPVPTVPTVPTACPRAIARTSPWRHGDEDHMAARGDGRLRGLVTRVAALIGADDQD